MFSKIREILFMHVKNNKKAYFFLLLAFIIGVSAGAFTVNGLSSIQREELTSYFKGFINLLDDQKVDSGEMFKVSIYENGKIVLMLWVLGLTIIGIPFIFLLVGIRGFITGFTAGFIIKTMGAKGLLFVFFTIFPKEVLIVPCIIALGVNGINFTLKMIKNKSIKQISKESLKSNFFAYCFVTLFFISFLIIGILLEVYVTPVFIRMISPILTN